MRTSKNRRTTNGDGAVGECGFISVLRRKRPVAVSMDLEDVKGNR